MAKRSSKKRVRAAAVKAANKAIQNKKNAHGQHSRDKDLVKAYRTGPAAFSTAHRLRKQTGKPMKEIEKFLERTNAYTKYRGVQRSFKRLKVIAYRINEIWSADLAFVDKLANYNDGIKYLLVAVDVLSRYVRVQPMKTKTAPATVEAFKKMLKSGKQPEKLWTDKGTEFRGEFAKFCEKRKIHSYSTNSETKSAFAERNIRSLKNKTCTHEGYQGPRTLSSFSGLYKQINQAPKIQGW